jgi:predicted transcriptional regulator
MVARTVKLPEELDARLRQRARGQKLTYSEAARRVLADGLRQDAGIDMLAALEKFAGAATGPKDLSTNKSYMNNYGSGPRRE